MDQSPNAVAGNKALSDVSSKSGEEMDHSLVVGEATSNVSGKKSEEVGFSSVPGGCSIQGAIDCNELNPEVNSLNSNRENQSVILGTSRDSPKGVDLDESNLEINSTKAKDETPLIVIDPVNHETSKGENLDESNLEFNSPHANTGEIPPHVQDPLQDCAKEKNLDEPDAEVPPVEPEASDVANAEQDNDEYACKYCHRKFSNKQSLGGHQNAHKFERALEKDASEAHKSGAGYLSGTSSYPRVTYPLSSHPGSLKRSYEYMNRPLQIRSPYHQSQDSQQMLQHQGMNVSRPVLPSILPQAVSRHFDENYRGYHSAGWTGPVPRNSIAVSTVPVPRVSQFVTAQHSYLPSNGLSTLQFPNQGAPSPSSMPVYQGLSAYPESRSVSGRNAGVQNNNQMNVPGSEEDESGLDLTLRL